MENSTNSRRAPGPTDQEFYHELTIAPPRWLTAGEPADKRDQVSE